LLFVCFLFLAVLLSHFFILSSALFPDVAAFGTFAKSVQLRIFIHLSTVFVDHRANLSFCSAHFRAPKLAAESGLRMGWWPA
jgi:hypothetical protein